MCFFQKYIKIRKTRTQYHLTATRIPPGRAWEAKAIIISTEGLHNNMRNSGA